MLSPQPRVAAAAVRGMEVSEVLAVTEFRNERERERETGREGKR